MFACRQQGESQIVSLYVSKTNTFFSKGKGSNKTKIVHRRSDEVGVSLKSWQTIFRPFQIQRQPFETRLSARCMGETVGKAVVVVRTHVKGVDNLHISFAQATTRPMRNTPREAIVLVASSGPKHFF